MGRQSGRFRRPLCFLLVLTGLSQAGCGTVHYLFQAAHGQFAISNRARPIEKVIEDERTPTRLKGLLSEVPSIKSYGETHGLKPTGNYKDYVHLDRDAAVWVVSACERLEFRPRVWGFPIVGSFTYLGWFDLNNAKDFAKELKEENLDVDLRGASAFSTLGWFRDPILSSMIPKGDRAMGALVNVVLHESVHASFYLNDQSYFNESLASFVADKMTPLYLKDRFGKDSKVFQTYQKTEKRQEVYQKRMSQAYQELSSLYSSEGTEDKKLAEKQRILKELTEATRARRPINNATLIQYRTYGLGMEEFAGLYNSCGKDWSRFWKAVQELDEDSFGGSQSEKFGEQLNLLQARC